MTFKLRGHVWMSTDGRSDSGLLSGKTGGGSELIGNRQRIFSPDVSPCPQQLCSVFWEEPECFVPIRWFLYRTNPNEVQRIAVFRMDLWQMHL